MCGPKLRCLDLSETKVSGDSLVGSTVRLEKLETLDLNCCDRLTDSGLCAFLSMCGPKLNDLYLSETNVSGDSLVGSTVQLENLETLILSSCDNLTNSGLCAFLSMCGPKLIRLDLSYTNVSGDSLYGSTVQLEKLEALILNRCTQLTNSGLCAFLSMCGPKLNYLSLKSTNVSGDSLVGSTVQLEKLETLILFYCKQLTDSGLCALLSMCGPKLRCLDLSCTKVSGDSLVGSTVRLKKLETLDLNCCDSLTDSGLCALLSKCGPTLNKLDLAFTNVSGALLADWMELQTLVQLREMILSGCPNVNAADKERLTALLPNCEIEY